MDYYCCLHDYLTPSSVQAQAPGGEWRGMGSARETMFIGRILRMNGTCPSTRIKRREFAVEEIAQHTILTWSSANETDAVAMQALDRLRAQNDGGRRTL